MRRFSRFKSRRGSATTNGAQNDGDDSAPLMGDAVNREDEGDGSPSAYLNLDQDQEEDVGQEDAPTATATSTRTKRGPSKLPKGRLTIIELDPTGEPIDPLSVVGPYKTAIGVIVRENVPIRYRYWISKQYAEWAVPTSIKDICWEKIQECFHFPDGTHDLARRKAMQIAGNSFKYLRYTLNKCVKDGTEPDWETYHKQKDYWEEFVEYKRSQEATSLSITNTENSQKNVNPHRTGSRGYLRKIPEWERKAEELTRSGVSLQTDGWEDRAVRYVLGHGASYNPDGTLTYKNPVVEEISRRVQEANQEVVQGAFQPDRENDTLTRALGNKEHPGRTRGTGVVPWKFSFEDDSGTYRSRGRKKAQQEAFMQEMMERIRQEVRQEVRQECSASQARLREEIEQRISQRAIGDSGTHGQASPVLNRSSCGSNTNPEDDALVRWPVDEIEAPRNCKLYVQAGFIKTKVAIGQAHPTGEGVMLHCRPLRDGYAKVTLDTLVRKRYGKLDLDYDASGESTQLKDNLRSFVPWRKRYISFSDDSESSEDDTNPSHDPMPPQRDPTPSPPRDPAPSPRRESTLPPIPPSKRRSSQRQPSGSANQTSSFPQEKATRKQKSVSGSITSLIPEKEDNQISHDVALKFLNNLSYQERPLPSDFERTSCKRSLRLYSEEVHKGNVEDSQAALMSEFCHTGNLTEKDLYRLQYGDSMDVLPMAPLARQFKMGNDLVSPNELAVLPTRMRALHKWYKQQSGQNFGARVPHHYFNKKGKDGEYNILWIEYKNLFEFYQQDALDVSIMSLWCL